MTEEIFSLLGPCPLTDRIIEKRKLDAKKNLLVSARQTGIPKKLLERFFPIKKNELLYFRGHIFYELKLVRAVFGLDNDENIPVNAEAKRALERHLKEKAEKKIPATEEFGSWLVKWLEWPYKGPPTERKKIAIKKIQKREWITFIFEGGGYLKKSARCTGFKFTKQS